MCGHQTYHERIAREFFCTVSEFAGDIVCREVFRKLAEVCGNTTHSESVGRKIFCIVSGFSGVYCLQGSIPEIGGSVWESNPPETAQTTSHRV